RAPRTRRQAEARPERHGPPEAPRADGQDPRPRGLDDLPGTDVFLEPGPVGGLPDRGGPDLPAAEGDLRPPARSERDHRRGPRAVQGGGHASRCGAAGTTPRRLPAQAQFRSRQALFRLVMSIPVLRQILMRPIEEEARRRVLEQLKNVRISEPHKVYNEYPHELSGGMQQRVMIAMALACDPALMIADEPTTSLDVTTQAQILTLVRDLRERIHSSILYITHDLAVI